MNQKKLLRTTNGIQIDYTEHTFKSTKPFHTQPKFIERFEQDGEIWLLLDNGMSTKEMDYNRIWGVLAR